MSGRLRHFACGRTTHDTARLFDGAPRGVRAFPAGVFLYEHDDRRVLFDTGYATGAWRTGWRGAAYRRLLPPEAGPADDVAAVLRADDVDPPDVTHVVLSHLHPDHIGGVVRFPQARFITTAGQESARQRPTLRSGILTGLLPDWYESAPRTVLAEQDFALAGPAGLRAHDLFGDGRLLVLDLPGHADGHIGLLVEGRVLLAGDAGWGADLLPAADRMRPLPRFVQHDATAYRATARTLGLAADAGIRVVCSHDPVTSRELL